MISKKSFDLNRLLRNRKALSPAIAVALLLAITIALVAAVSYAATNATPSTETAPQGVFNVEISKTAGYIRMREISGDAIFTGNLKLVFDVNGVRTETLPDEKNTFYGYGAYDVTNATSGSDPVTIWVSVSNASATDLTVQVYDADSDTWVDAPLGEGTYVYTSASGTAYNCQNYSVAAPVAPVIYTDIKVTSSAGLDATGLPAPSVDGLTAGDEVACVIYEYTSPWLQTGDSPSTHPEINFGQFTLSAGSMMKALSMGSSSDDARGVISNWLTVSVGDTVAVSIIYTPTNQVIWQGDVIVG